MYCKKCELEIKGDDKETCPICDSPLIDNLFNNNLKLDDDSIENDNIDELIGDIDEKVDLRLDDDNKSDAGVSDSVDDDFQLQLEDKKDDSGNDLSDDNVFDLVLEDDKESSESVPIEESGDDLIREEITAEETIEKKEEEPEEEGPESIDLSINDIKSEVNMDDLKNEEVVNDEQADARIDLENEINTAIENDDVMQKEVSDVETKSNDEELTTKEILDKALDELDSVNDDKLSYEKKPSTNWSAVIGILAILVVFAGGGLYYLKYKTGSAIYKKPAIKIAAKEDKGLNKLLKRDVVKDEKRAEPAKPKKNQLAEKTAKPVVNQPKTVKKKVTAEEKKLQVERVTPSKEIIKKQHVKPAESVIKTTVKKPLTMPAVTYVVHAGSFKKNQVAQQEAKRFNNKGFQAYVERKDLTKNGKGIWYRVIIGRFSTRAKAEIEQKKLSSKFNVQSRIIRSNR